MKRQIEIAFTMFALMLAFFFFPNIPLTADRAPSTEPSTQPATQAAGTVFVEADTLWKAYKQNAMRADSIYGGQTLFVRGKVTEIRIDLLGRPTVDLGDPEVFGGVNCIFDKDSDDWTLSRIKALNVGDSVVISGRVDHAISSFVELRAMVVNPDEAGREK